MRTLVTGATGFLGGFLMPVLLDHPEYGKELTVLVRNPEALDSRLKGRVHIVQGDVTDSLAVERATQGAETVFHLAASVAVRRSERQAARQTNELGTRNLVEASLKNGIGKFLHVSSVAAIGASERPSDLLVEDSPNLLKGRGFVNFDSKIKAEEIVLDACRERGLHAVVVNPSMIFGAGDARKAARKGSILAAQGKLPFYPSGGISVVAAEDVVDGMIRAISKGRTGQRYILSGENLSFEQVFGFYAEFSGKSRPRLRLPKNILGALGAVSDLLGLDGQLSGESAAAASLYHWYDHSKASRELGFSPRPAEVAIRASVEWIGRCAAT